MPREKNSASNIYFLLCENLIKIGRAVDVQKRIVSLKVGNPGRQVSLLGFVSGDKAEERALHQHLKNYRAEGEWFRCDKFVLDTIDRVMLDGFSASGVVVEDVRPITAMHPVEQDAYAALDVIFTLEKLIGADTLQNLSVSLGLKEGDLRNLKYRDRKNGLMMGEVESIHKAAARAVDLAYAELEKIKHRVFHLPDRLQEMLKRSKASSDLAAALDGSRSEALIDVPDDGGAQ